MTRLPLLAAAAAAGLALPAAASAVIVPQHSIGDVRIGYTAVQTVDAAGPPLVVNTGRNIFGRYVQYRYRGFSVNFQGARRVTSVSTRSTLQRTRGGVGVGTTEAVLRSRIRGVTCSTFSGFRNCVLGVEEPGRRVTAFAMRNGRVAQVTIGIVID
ncbi:MAG TPA: hypothetical protein VNT51_00195 [Miltoncostaeaceae bacterium]|nr:hypothetical protein [Miltoncostaeaceae bacterium]